MRRILLARHGETAWNAIGRMQGHTDIELNDRGRAQAKTLAVTLESAGVVSVWSSDLARARETAAIVAGELGLAAPQLDADLRERRFGVFEGLTRDECIARYPDEWRAWSGARIHPPGSESRDDATARIQRAIIRVHDAASGAVLVVTHGGVMRLWLTDLLNTAIPPIGNAAVYTVEHDGTAFRAHS